MIDLADATTLPRTGRITPADRRAGCERFAPNAFGQRLLTVLQRAIPADGLRLFCVDSTTLLYNRLLAATEGDASFRARWLREIYLSHGPAAYMSPPLVMRTALTVTLIRDRQDCCWGLPMWVTSDVTEHDHRSVFHETLSPPGGYLRTCLAVNGRWIGALDMVSRNAARPLGPADAAFMQRLAPTIARGLAAALAREHALRYEDGEQPSSSGVLLLTHDRRVAYVTPAGEAWLQLIQDARRDDRSLVPTAVWSAVAGLRLEQDGKGAHTVVAPTALGPVRIEASPGGDGSIAVVLTPVRPPEPPAVPDFWPLTSQERQVVSLLLQGLSNRELAGALNVSEKTVEAHLGHAYEKVGVGSRTQLLAQLFRDAYLPSFRFPPDNQDSVSGK